MRNVPNAASDSGRPEGIDLVVIHTAECACVTGLAFSVAQYLAGLKFPNRASTHYMVDPDTTISQVAEGNQAWTAPGSNVTGVQIEQAGHARFTAAEWLTGEPERMIRTQLIPLIADICRRNDIPAVWLTATDLLAGLSGITGHVQVSQAFGLTDHWDPGTGFPGVAVAASVAALLGKTPTPLPDLTRLGTSPMHVLRAGDSNLYLVRSDHKILLADALKAIGVEPTAVNTTQAANELAAAKLTPEPWSNVGWFALGVVPWETAAGTMTAPAPATKK